MTQPHMSGAPLRLALIFDFVEEGWASMDLVGEMILRNLVAHHAGAVDVSRIRPEFRQRAFRWPGLKGHPFAQNLDRLLNRMHDYPRYVRRRLGGGEFDVFHLVDHSYSQLVHALPPERTVVTCHDLDTFRCLLEPAREPRPRWFRAMARRILTGMQKAAAIACDSEMTRDQILAYGLVPAQRLHVVYLAIDESLSPQPDPEIDPEIDRLLGPARPGAPPDLLHVGTNIPRKRIDVLLGTCAGVRKAWPGARLIKVGGALNPQQARLAESLKIKDGIVSLPFFDPQDPRQRRALAAVYRRAALVLQPSDAEGFGLPVAEGLACGTPVLASDIAVLREVGGLPATYAPVGDVPAWTEAVLALLDERDRGDGRWQERRQAGIARAERFRWKTHVGQLMAIYRSVCSSV
jgi:glycosyltransferase involved in cell wall biosynthesis